MNMDLLQELFVKRQMICNVLDCMSSGFNDEWILKESYNGQEVKITAEMWDILHKYLNGEIDRIDAKLNGEFEKCGIR